jgi:amidophosphoribosyltransferase
MCGLVAIKTNDKTATELALSMLLRLQHRGQDGAGISVLNANGDFRDLRGLGLIQNALHDWPSLPQSGVALAHTRYATTGLGTLHEIQPFVKRFPRFAIAHNGNLANTLELTEKYGLILQSTSDLDVISQVLVREWKDIPSVAGFQTALEKIMSDFIGAYAVIGVMSTGDLFAFRDPYGIRPLFLAKTPDAIALASETSAFALLGASNSSTNTNVEIEEVPPGSWVMVKGREIIRGQVTSTLNPQKLKRHCMFELVYFSSPHSEYAGRSMYTQRFNLGIELAKQILAGETDCTTKEKANYDYVVPVPDTSRAAAIAVAEHLHVPYREYLVKNAYVPRTFILSNNDKRLKALDMKLSLIGPEIGGKNILLVDDSVVRGNTSKRMISKLKEAGAKRVGLASTCPPILYPCYYGIDFPDPSELVAHERTLPEIAAAIGVDDLYYLTKAGLQNALGTPELCMACLDQNYPLMREGVFESFTEQRRGERGC